MEKYFESGIFTKSMNDDIIEEKSTYHFESDFSMYMDQKLREALKREGIPYKLDHNYTNEPTHELRFVAHVFKADEVDDKLLERKSIYNHLDIDDGKLDRNSFMNFVDELLGIIVSMMKSHGREIYLHYGILKVKHIVPYKQSYLEYYLFY